MSFIQQSLDFDITRNRHNANPQSEAANTKIEPHKANWRDRILILMAYREHAGLKGTTLADLCKAFTKYPNQLSGRCSELLERNLIRRTGEVRNGHAVYVINSIEDK